MVLCPWWSLTLGPPFFPRPRDSRTTGCPWCRGCPELGSRVGSDVGFGHQPESVSSSGRALALVTEFAQVYHCLSQLLLRRDWSHNCSSLTELLCGHWVPLASCLGRDCPVPGKVV